MSEDSNGDVGTANILFLVGAVGIGIWFLITAGEGADYGVSPIYVAFYFAPICLIGMLLFLLVNALSSSKKGVKTIVVESKEELEELLAQEEEKKAQVSFKQILLLAFIGAVIIILPTVVVVLTQW